MEDEKKQSTEISTNVNQAELAKDFYANFYKKHRHLTKTAKNIDILEQYQEYLSQKVGIGNRLYSQTVVNLKNLREAKKLKHSDLTTWVQILVPGALGVVSTCVAIDMITTAEQTGSALNSRSMALALKPINYIKGVIK